MSHRRSSTRISMNAPSTQKRKNSSPEPPPPQKSLKSTDTRIPEPPLSGRYKNFSPSSLDSLKGTKIDTETAIYEGDTSHESPNKNSDTSLKHPKDSPKVSRAKGAEGDTNMADDLFWYGTVPQANKHIITSASQTLLDKHEIVEETGKKLIIEAVSMGYMLSHNSRNNDLVNSISTTIPKMIADLSAAATSVSMNIADSNTTQAKIFADIMNSIKTADMEQNMPNRSADKIETAAEQAYLGMRRLSKIDTITQYAIWLGFDPTLLASTDGAFGYMVGVMHKPDALLHSMTSYVTTDVGLTRLSSRAKTLLHNMKLRYPAIYPKKARFP